MCVHSSLLFTDFLKCQLLNYTKYTLFNHFLQHIYFKFKENCVTKYAQRYIFEVYETWVYSHQKFILSKHTNKLVAVLKRMSKKNVDNLFKKDFMCWQQLLIQEP